MSDFIEIEIDGIYLYINNIKNKNEIFSIFYGGYFEFENNDKSSLTISKSCPKAFKSSNNRLIHYLIPLMYNVTKDFNYKKSANSTKSISVNEVLNDIKKFDEMYKINN